MSTTDISARIGEWTLPPELNRPEVSTRGSAKTTTLEPIDTAPVEQQLAPGATERTITGQAFSQAVEYFQYLRAQDGTVEIRTEQTGTIRVIVTSVDATSTGVWYDDQNEYIYDFTITAKQTTRLRNPLDESDSDGGGGGGSSGGDSTEPVVF